MTEDTDKEKKKEKKSEGFDLSNMVQEIGKFTRNFNTLSKIVDYISLDLMPKMFGDNVDEVYRQTKKNIDNFIRYLF
jgi:hypothetical protein